VIAGLNGMTPGGWTGYARAPEDASAVPLELNTYSSPGGPEVPGRQIEQRLVEVLDSVKAAFTIPVKLSPHLSSIGEMDGFGYRRLRGPVAFRASSGYAS
jgi:dihydroorotate dehydrogenase (fumarate)